MLGRRNRTPLTKHLHQAIPVGIRMTNSSISSCKRRRQRQTDKVHPNNNNNNNNNGRITRGLLLTLFVSLISVPHQAEAQPLLELQQQQQQEQAEESICSLCEDGSLPSTSTRTIWEKEEWNCQDLSQILTILGVSSNSDDCDSLQFQGFRDCGCPTFPAGSICSLCPGGFTNIEDPTMAIPGYPGVTCGDILFARREDNDDDANPTTTTAAAAATLLSCTELERFSRFCKCPEACSLCRYNDEVPQFPQRVIPFLSTLDQEVTCADHAAQVERVPFDRCESFLEPPVPVDTSALCGCPMSSPPNLCTLCPQEGQRVRDPSLIIPQAGGRTCAELEEYLSFVTERDSCLSIASVAQACCQDYDPCPVCADGTNGLGSSKTYEPYKLSCDQVGVATRFGYPLTCERAQERFPFFCRCPGAKAECTICPLGMLPPDPARYMPLLDMTCGELNDFLSLRSAEECSDVIMNFSVDVGDFCGCIPTEASLARGRCALCPEGQEVLSLTEMPHQVSVTATGGLTATSSHHCHELADLAPFVVKAELCQAVQQSTPVCCRPIGQQTPAPTEAPNTRFPVPTSQAPVVTLQPSVSIISQNETLVPGGGIVTTSAPTTTGVGTGLPVTTTPPLQTLQPSTIVTEGETVLPNTTVPPATTVPVATPAPTEEDSAGVVLPIWTVSSIILAWIVL